MKNAWGGIFIVTHLRTPAEHVTRACVHVCVQLSRASLQFFKALSPKHKHTRSSLIRSVQSLHQRITINCHLSQLKRCEGSAAAFRSRRAQKKAADRLWRLRGAPGASGASPCPESSLHCGGRSSQGPLLIWRPFSSLSHLQVGAHTAKGLLTISALFHHHPPHSLLLLLLPPASSS